MDQQKHSWIGRAVRSTPVLVIAFIAALIPILAWLLNESVRDRVSEAWYYVHVEHPQGALRVLIAVVALLLLALLLALARAGFLRRALSTANGRVQTLQRQLDESRVGPDRALFAELRKLLPSDRGPIPFLRRQSLSSFPNEILVPIDKFRYGWDNAEHEFLDPQIEAKRAKLLDAVNVFGLAVVRWTFALPGDRQGVPPEWKYTPRQEEFERGVAELETAADQVVAAHQDLFREARMRLGDPR